jgi:hypothetical protein
MNAFAVPRPIIVPRLAIWAVLALALAALVVPDCCLNGRHAFGAGMDAFGPICRSAR